MRPKTEVKPYTVERLNNANLCDVEKLHTAVYGRIPETGYFYKKYNTSFTGLIYVGYVAYNAERMPIGYYGVLPCFIKLEGRRILAAQSADTMTHPEHRLKGLFVDLANRTFQLCSELGIELLFGFPNQNSLPGFINKLGWTTTGSMSVFIIRQPVTLQMIINRFLKKLWSSYTNRQLNKSNLVQNGFTSSIFEDGFGGIDRDETYLNYKTHNKTYTIKLGQSTLWLKLTPYALVLGDILLKPEDFDAVIRQLKKLAGKVGLKEIHFHASDGTSIHQLFAGYLTATPSFPVIFKELGASKIETELLKFTSADIDTF